jgi:hypothetical protein
MAATTREWHAVTAPFLRRLCNNPLQPLSASEQHPLFVPTAPMNFRPLPRSPSTPTLGAASTSHQTALQPHTLSACPTTASTPFLPNSGSDPHSPHTSGSNGSGADQPSTASRGTLALVLQAAESSAWTLSGAGAATSAAAAPTSSRPTRRADAAASATSVVHNPTATRRLQSLQGSPDDSTASLSSVASSPYPAHLFNPGSQPCSSSPPQPTPSQLAAASFLGFAAGPTMLRRGPCAALFCPPQSAPTTSAHALPSFISPGRLWSLQMLASPPATRTSHISAHCSPGRLLESAYAALPASSPPSRHCVLLQRPNADPRHAAGTSLAPAPPADHGRMAAALAVWGPAAAPLLPRTPLGCPLPSLGSCSSPPAIACSPLLAEQSPSSPPAHEPSATESTDDCAAGPAPLRMHALASAAAHLWTRLVKATPPSSRSQVAQQTCSCSTSSTSRTSGQSQLQGGRSLSPDSAHLVHPDAGGMGGWVRKVWL